ncbi:hypothetical protein BVJ53_04800 [Lacticaseibacillus chiayiensis]|uniref:Uncharacterized protein n=1 Tax=Lacticaseibacillus chiayiensis TaxID=2100821 RepID=A0A4Q1U607_9LACO|nr:hypothetical protein [Lacticaseibacillus chiayiensis]QVI35010.1 hypothetical protein KG086_01300 [Lacticaseibacillus chiayiensis]RXT27062.1 hypothetical protein BVJ53_04800 [Lacticaseibacillus chiayiensis]UYN56790.1 hypothetical protein OFW50_01400 [Lacticaseibacillus chiayiensis]
MKYFGVTLASTEATHITRDNFFEPLDLTIRKRLLFNYALKNRRWIKVNGFLRRPGDWINEKEAFEVTNLTSRLPLEQLQRRYPDYYPLINKSHWLQRRDEAQQLFDTFIPKVKRRKRARFEDEIMEFCQSNGFQQITSLRTRAARSAGAYVLVLDDYLSIYFSVVPNIATGITAHWDALLDLDAITSFDALPIDAFKPLDTTRIFVRTTEKRNLEKLKSELTDLVPYRYTLNQTSPGIPGVDSRQETNAALFPKGVEVHDAMGGYELFEYDLARELNIHPRKDDESK